MSFDASRPPAAVLFDIDGTLVDSNYLHVFAWIGAFQSVGRPVEAWRIHRAIGMDSKKLLERLLGQDAEEFGEQASAEHARRYKELSGLLRPFDGARELLHIVSEHGAKVVLATSAPPDELGVLRQILDVDDVVDVVTNADEVDTAKPEPDIIEVALTRAEIRAADAVFVGDAIWDMQAAKSAGVRCIAVRSGGVDTSELTSAGANETYDNVQQLLDSYDDSLLATPRNSSE
jgi:HAD superfamily hydrolase (TIGR01509 family)